MRKGDAKPGSADGSAFTSVSAWVAATRIPSPKGPKQRRNALSRLRPRHPVPSRDHIRRPSFRTRLRQVQRRCGAGEHMEIVGQVEQLRIETRVTELLPHGNQHVVRRCPFKFANPFPLVQQECKPPFGPISLASANTSDRDQLVNSRGFLRRSSCGPARSSFSRALRLRKSTREYHRSGHDDHRTTPALPQPRFQRAGRCRDTAAARISLDYRAHCYSSLVTMAPR